MDTADKARQGFGVFEETAHELEQAAAERAESAAARARRGGVGGADLLVDAVRSRPIPALLIACAAGFALGWLPGRR